MGVRGLTTFIGANAEVYLKPYELHDTNLVIDGDNLCMQLFKKSLLTSSPLGGNYDLYHRIVVDFFKMLNMCNVVPYVLLDGGYESRKLPTVKKRMLQTILSIRSISVTHNARPLMLREVFVDAMGSVGVQCMRCAFEADDEAAILARKLNCPVLSYDSDFYIHNVQYIPYVTLSHKVYRKVTDKEGENFEIGIIEWNRSKNGARRSQRVKFVAQYGDEAVVNSDATETYCYLDCCMYTIDSLIGPNDRLEKDMIPLFAVLLGNDYIERKVFASFYRTIRSGRINRKINRQQRRIKVILKWLQNHTLQSATRTIVNHVRAGNRKHIYRQILTAIRGYNCEDCVSFGYFGFHEECTNGAIDDEDIEKNIHDCLGNFSANMASDTLFEETKGEKGIVQQCDIHPQDNANELEALDEENAEDCDYKSDAEDSTTTQNSSETEEESISFLELENLKPMQNEYTDFDWPEWFRKLYRSAKVPRFLADLLNSNFYLNYPQIENITQPDSNTISYPILRIIFALLKSSSKRPTTEFNYLTRSASATSVYNITFDDVQLPDGVSFDPAIPRNFPLMQELYKECKVAGWEDLFKRVRNLPSNLQLYFIIIIYWAKNCTIVNVAHVQALVVCILQLQIVDPSLKSKNRDLKLFNQQYKSYLETQREVLKNAETSTDKNDDQSEDFTRAFYNRVSSVTSRAELMLTYEKLIPYFSPFEKRNRGVVPIVTLTVHTFAELQSVCYNFFALVPLLGYPFDNVRMHELFNSMFVYNVYETIRDRTNPFDYVCSTFFRYSPILQTACRRMVKFVEKYVPELHERNRCTKAHRKVNAATPKNKKVNAKLGNTKRATPLPAKDLSHKDDTTGSDNEFVDVNNRFSQLLLAS